jgi:hypothetical protein
MRAGPARELKREIEERVFPLGPKVRVPPLSEERRALLDEILALEYRPVVIEKCHWGNRRRVLRRLIADGLVEVLALSPAAYRVTKLGLLAMRLRG